MVGCEICVAGRHHHPSRQPSARNRKEAVPHDRDHIAANCRQRSTSTRVCVDAGTCGLKQPQTSAIGRRCMRVRQAALGRYRKYAWCKLAETCRLARRVLSFRIPHPPMVLRARRYNPRRRCRRCCSKSSGIRRVPQASTVNVSSFARALDRLLHERLFASNV